MSCRKAEKGWWPERESNPRHEDFQWRVEKFPEYFQLVAKLKSRCATECATPSSSPRRLRRFQIVRENRVEPHHMGWTNRCRHS